VFNDPTTVTDVTVTAAIEADSSAFVWESSDDGERWDVIATTHREALRPDRTTPFTLTTPATARMLRLRAVVPLELRQLEFFDLSGLPALGSAMTQGKVQGS
jgi:hypothetical protein